MANLSTKEFISVGFWSISSISSTVAPITSRSGIIPEKLSFSLVSVFNPTRKSLIPAEPAFLSMSVINVLTCSSCFVLIVPVASPSAITESFAYSRAVAESKPAFLSILYAIVVFFNSFCWFCSCSIASWNADFGPSCPGPFMFWFSLLNTSIALLPSDSRSFSRLFVRLKLSAYLFASSAVASAANPAATLAFLFAIIASFNVKIAIANLIKSFETPAEVAAKIAAILSTSWIPDASFASFGFVAVKTPWSINSCAPESFMFALIDPVIESKAFLNAAESIWPLLTSPLKLLTNEAMPALAFLMSEPSSFVTILFIEFLICSSLIWTEKAESLTSLFTLSNVDLNLSSKPPRDSAANIPNPSKVGVVNSISLKLNLSVVFPASSFIESISVCTASFDIPFEINSMPLSSRAVCACSGFIPLTCCIVFPNCSPNLLSAFSASLAFLTDTETFSKSSNNSRGFFWGIKPK